ncbi:MAG: hypothetical protein GF331_14465 [Chitinivibrionales bacterium]|nr:hypothetical protein [Chitinivibrionales bacterium]
MQYVRRITVTPSDYYMAEMLDDWLEYGPSGIRVAERTLRDHIDFAFRELYLRRLDRMKEASSSVGRRRRDVRRRETNCQDMSKHAAHRDPSHEGL